MNFLVDVMLPLALAVIMIGLGLRLTIEDFRRVVREPVDFVVGMLSQVVLLPAVAFALASVWPMAPELALGLMILAAAPGGVTSNILTAFARGDVALSISLTAVVSLLSVITIPLIAVASYEHFLGERATGDISVAGTALAVFLIVAVPVALGMAVRRWAEGFAQRIEPAVRRVSVVLFVLVFAGAVWQERANILPYLAEAGAVTLTLNLLMMGIAWTLARRVAVGPAQRAAITIECGFQNGTLALAVAVLLFDGGAVLVAPATYSVLMFVTALAYIGFLRYGR